MPHCNVSSKGLHGTPMPTSQVTDHFTGLTIPMAQNLSSVSWAGRTTSASDRYYQIQSNQLCVCDWGLWRCERRWETQRRGGKSDWECDSAECAVGFDEHDHCQVDGGRCCEERAGERESVFEGLDWCFGCGSCSVLWYARDHLYEPG